ncbi:antibiotic biosynthesis monooxygenase [Acetobacteraceae bacterium ESL0709]|nr:antibiotic biosynthesis monooxygenase [Acetobacteraceae bacterium ESL0697]MDF7677173.1 antibiotic biosynthesis monooxygenase [Acetobacteraceae bacterium ESL0709]
MSGPVYLTAILTVPSQGAAELEQEIKHCVVQAREEPACQHYSFYGDIEKPGRFIANEVWASQVGLEAHNASPHLQALVATLKRLGGDIEVIKVSPIEPRA